MNKKRATLTAGGFLGIAVVTSIALLLGSGASTPDTFDASSTLKLNMKKNYNATKVPPGFDHANNAATAKRLGIEGNKTAILARNSNNSSSLTINQEIKKEGDYYVGEGGTGELIIEGKKHNFTINSSNISHAELKNGQNLLTGSLETEITDTNGKTVPTTISFTSIVETGDQFFYVAMGTLEEGPVVLSFGDDSFGTEEIYNIVRGIGNVEEEEL